MHAAPHRNGLFTPNQPKATEVTWKRVDAWEFSNAFQGECRMKRFIEGEDRSHRPASLVSSFRFLPSQYMRSSGAR